MYPELQEIIATIEDILPPKYISATIGCFWDGEKVSFNSTTTNHPAGEGQPAGEECLQLTQRVKALISEYREDCGDEWKTAVFGIFADGHINIYFGDEVPLDHLETFLSEFFSEAAESSPEVVETLGEAMT